MLRLGFADGTTGEVAVLLYERVRTGAWPGEDVAAGGSTFTRRVTAKVPNVRGSRLSEDEA